MAKKSKNNYIKHVRKACSITSNMMEKCIRLIPTFTHEKQIKRYLSEEAKNKRLRLAFKIIAASAKNAANPHYSKCKSRLKKGFLMIDFGVKVNGFCSDMTRTVYLGKISNKERILYKKVLDVQLKSIRMLKNKPASFAYKYARKRLGKWFIHSLGHGIGRRIHQKPTINSKNNEVIGNNVCFTVEPGVYHKKRYGIRIEDTVIKKNGRLKILTPLSKKLQVFDNNIYK